MEEARSTPGENGRAYLAEAIGTFVLVFAGCGSAVLAGSSIGFTGVAFAFGLALLTLVYAIGPISGCHVNPAVTLGVFWSGQLTRRAALGYIVSQFAGAILGAGAVLAIARGLPGGYEAAASGLAANGYGSYSPDGYSRMTCFLAESLLTALLVFTVLTTTARNAHRSFAGIAIGTCLTLIHLVGIPITNASVNPARSLGPAVFVGGWAMAQLWLFFLAPTVGAALASTLFRMLREPSQRIPEREQERRGRRAA